TKLFGMLSTPQATPTPQVKPAPAVRPEAAPEVQVAPQMQAAPQVPTGAGRCDITSNVMLRANKPLPDVCCGYASGSWRRGDFLMASFVMKDTALASWRDAGPCKCLSSGIEGKFGVWVKP